MRILKAEIVPNAGEDPILTPLEAFARPQLMYRASGPSPLHEAGPRRER